MKTMKKIRVLAIAALIPMTLALPAAAVDTIVWEQNFDTDVSGWFDSDDEWFGTITRNAGDGTATVEGDASSAPFSRFDGFRSEWPGNWTAEIDVFLDPSWAMGTGFDYSVAATGSDGEHQRDFIFHVAVDDQGLWVGASNNSGFAPPSRIASNISGVADVTAAGWYTLRHEFTDDGGVLAVTMTVLDQDGGVVASSVRTTPADTIPDEVGGNRYAWFTYISVPGGVEVDNHRLLIDVSAKDDCKNGGFEDFGFRNQGQCVAAFLAASKR